MALRGGGSEHKKRAPVIVALALLIGIGVFILRRWKSGRKGEGMTPALVSMGDYRRHPFLPWWARLFGLWRLGIGRVAYLATGLTSMSLKGFVKEEERFEDVDVTGVEAGMSEGGFDEVASELYARLGDIYGASPDEVALQQNVSEGLNKLLGTLSFKEGDNIVITSGGFVTIEVIGRWLAQVSGATLREVGGSTGEITEAIDDHTKLVLVEAINYKSGRRYNLQSIRRKINQVGSEAKLVVDDSQNFGVRRLNLHQDGIDAILTAGYKAAGGHNGCGFVIWEESWWSKLDDEQLAAIGWAGVDTVQGTYRPRKSARMLEVGGRPWSLVFKLLLSVRYVMKLDPEDILEHSLALGTEVIQGVKRLNDEEEWGFTILTPEDREERGMNVCILMNDAVATELCKRMNRHRVVLARGRGRLRVTLWVHNNSRDVKRFLKFFPIVMREMGFIPGTGAWE